MDDTDGEVTAPVLIQLAIYLGNEITSCVHILLGPLMA